MRKIILPERFLAFPSCKGEIESVLEIISTILSIRPLIQIDCHLRGRFLRMHCSNLVLVLPAALVLVDGVQKAFRT